MALLRRARRPRDIVRLIGAAAVITLVLIAAFLLIPQSGHRGNSTISCGSALAPGHPHKLQRACDKAHHMSWMYAGAAGGIFVVGVAGFALLEIETRRRIRRPRKLRRIPRTP